MGVDAWALLVAVGSLVFSGVVWFTSRRDAKAARADADRALAAAETSARAADRSADAAERQVELATPAAVGFEIRQIQSSRFGIWNTGTGTATEVTIDEPASGHARDLPTGLTLPAGDSVPFSLMGSWGSPIPTSLRVSCAELPEPVYVPVPIPE